jgi:pimeloyl-ACP methyl ester carboxylesterase
MSTRRESRQEAYDVIVVGSGMGGLAAAALLAKAGQKTLVIARHNRPGVIRARISAEEVPVRRGRPSDRRLRTDGESAGRPHRPASPGPRRSRSLYLPEGGSLLHRGFPGFRLAAPLGVEDFLAAHVDHFPWEAQQLRTVLELCALLNREVREFPSALSLWDVVRMPKRFPRLLRCHNATLGTVMDAHLRDPRLKVLFAAL